MKKFTKLYIMLSVLGLLALSVAACSCDLGEKPDITSSGDIVVTFRSDGFVHATVKVEPGAAMPADPQKDGFEFEGWFLDWNTFAVPFDGFSGVDKSMSVFAKWVDAGQDAPPTPRTAFIVAIGAVGEVGLASGGLLANALEKYNALSDAEKERADVKAAKADYDAKYAAFEALVAAQESEETQKAADEFIRLVGLLPESFENLTPTKADAEKIAAARAAFESLSTAAKAAVGVAEALSLLAQAETEYDKIRDVLVLVLVIDASTSMCLPVRGSAGNKKPYDDDMILSRLWAAAQGAKEAVNALGGNDFVGIVQFNSTARQVLPITSAARKPEINYAIENNIVTSQGTVYGGGINMARSLMDGVNPDCKRHVIFLTDGIALDGDAGVSVFQNAIALMLLEGITLSVVGVSDDVRDAQARAILQSMADMGGGEFYSVPGTTFNNTLVQDIMKAEAERVKSLPAVTVPDITSVTIPEGATAIEAGAFRGYAKLTGITIPTSVTSIGSDAFFGCGALSSITIPDSVTSIGERAFFGCKSLKEIVVPESVTEIGIGAFFGCDALTKITLPFIGNTPTAVYPNTHFGY
ncbi:MAG: leucine-rich repeat protein, partial [Firmicutes bacterium]|nr:leucine-rich repeat protein [Bacillota bacterium]